MTLTTADLETPIPIVDLDALRRNLDRAAEYATSHKLALRPHIKTHKSPRIAAEQLARGAVGVTCATPFEAEVMSAVCHDILVAYPPVGHQRAARLAALDPKVKLTIALDSMEAIGEIAHAAHSLDREIGILIELDLGMRRVGTRVDRAIELAKMLDQRPLLDFAGIAFYPGHIRETVGEQDARLEDLSNTLKDALERFDAAGVPAKVVSGGSTPTLWRTHEIHGVTEFRPGTYVYNDRTTAAVGACAWEDCALTVLATVVSTSVSGQAVVDAGTKALGREPMRGTDTMDGFGCLAHDRDVIVKAMSEEHGILDLSRTLWRPKVGDKVRIIPNHVCIVVHLNDVIAGVRGDVVETSWPVTARGRGFHLGA